MTYTMTFVFAPRGFSFLLLLKPQDHKNPLFRGNWTAPGGKLEDGELPLAGAIRELKEETGLKAKASEMRLVCRFYCNCDPTEPEHEVIVYGVKVPKEKMRKAKGLKAEPVRVFRDLPGNIVWHVLPLWELAWGRLKQPK